MHVVATNLCVWIRTLVLESLKEIMAYLALSEESKAALVTTNATPLFFGGGVNLAGELAALRAASMRVQVASLIGGPLSVFCTNSVTRVYC